MNDKYKEMMADVLSYVMVPCAYTAVAVYIVMNGMPAVALAVLVASIVAIWFN